ncbi:MAG: tetratricopeptide (TPR) repeat protein [Candidatus Paceibacteria bacterium]|jgi:tetratricopeptide (TPR) repeat protein
MLKFTTLFNFSLVGALVAPAALQKGSSSAQLERSLDATTQALASLELVQMGLDRKDYAAVDSIISATEDPFGGIRERGQLLDELRRNIGELELEVQHMETPTEMEYLNEDPTANLQVNSEGATTVATPGLTTAELAEVGNVWPPVQGSKLPTARREGNLYRFEKDGYTVDAVRQGRAYYRATRYKEALRLIETRAGEPQADYWIGRTLERLDRPAEAIAAYTKVIENETSGPLAQRAEDDRDFLMWLIDFDRKMDDYSKSGGKK